MKTFSVVIEVYGPCRTIRTIRTVTAADKIQAGWLAETMVQNEYGCDTKIIKVVRA